MRYAIGEVVLIMLGIFMALQLQNWNEKRKDESAYLKSLEQIYNGLIGDQLMHQSQKAFHYGQLNFIDSILNHQDVIRVNELPLLLIRASLEDIDQASLISYHFNNLTGTNGTEARNELTKHLSSYNSMFNESYSFENRDVENLFKELALKFPFVTFNYLYSGELSIEETYAADEVEDLKNPVIRKKLRSILSNLKNQHQQYAAMAEHRELLTISLINQIKIYSPEVKLIYANVGIIGTAINGWDTDGARSTPMIRIDERENIWTVTMELNEGLVKFRCNDTWFQDWGGTTFPLGEAYFKGPDIPVKKAGLYKITLNIDEQKYEFRKLDAQ